MRVLVADKFEQSGIAGLTAAGHDVEYRPDVKDASLVEALRETGAEVLVVRSTKVAEAAMPDHLRLIVRAGAGVNTIDVNAATARRILVANCPGRNAIAVAELAFGLILALDRRIPDNVADLRAGRWNKKEYSNARGLYGTTIGLLGAGSIACEMIRRADAFGMPVVLWSRRFNGQDRALTAAEADTLGGDRPVGEVPVRLVPSPQDVAARARILSIHLALAPETKGIVNAAVFDRLAPGSFVVNTARGEVIDYGALRQAIRDRQLRVALDVFEREPTSASGAFEDDIVREPGVYGTHHIGASTDQAQEAIARETLRIIETFAATGRAPNCVNG